MLIITRQLQEAITIGDNVTVTVLAVNGNQVRLGIDAPREVAVHREEIYERIHNDEASPRERYVSIDQTVECDPLPEPQDSRKKTPLILMRKRRTW